jgi:sugar lactone lactonase YvrE
VDLDVIAEGFGYVESPRWHAGRLWLSDFDRKTVVTVAADGTADVFARVPGTPSGLAFRDGEVLVSSMRTGEVLAVGPGGRLAAFADLSGVAVGHLNDMARSDQGTLYVGCFGYDLEAREKPRPGPLIGVDDAGQVSVACPDVTFANGMVVTGGGRELLVAETPRRIITRFRIADDGSLADRAVFADLGRRQPDGLCLDADGGIWAGCPFSEEFIRLDRTGKITHVVPTPGRWAVACALGGEDGSTFFGLTAETDLGRYARGDSIGRVEAGPAPYPARS